jgi:Domain of Unknown Function (DUF1080)
MICKNLLRMRCRVTSSFAAFTCVLLFSPSTNAAEPEADADGWIVLFDGKTLDGWHKNPEKIGHGTGGRWSVEPDGVLAGEQDPPGSGNGGILLTDRKFGDFELSIEMKPNWGSDSGIFLRSTDKGQCIQILVDYYNRGNVGHFYGEATGGWGARTFSLRGHEEDGKLVKLTTMRAQPAKDVGLVESCTPEEWLKVWKIGDWNQALIRVEGGRLPVITTQINGLKVGVFDASSATIEKYDREEVAKLLGERGSIALQVHGGDSYPPGAKCRYRNIRIREL